MWRVIIVEIAEFFFFFRSLFQRDPVKMGWRYIYSGASIAQAGKEDRQSLDWQLVCWLTSTTLTSIFCVYSIYVKIVLNWTEYLISVYVYSTLQNVEEKYSSGTVTAVKPPVQNPSNEDIIDKTPIW